MLVAINPILQKYMDENNIDVVVEKKYILTAKSSKDITDKVLAILDKELKSIKFKINSNVRDNFFVPKGPFYLMIYLIIYKEKKLKISDIKTLDKASKKDITFFNSIRLQIFADNFN